MLVTDVKTFVVGNPPPRFGGRYFIFVKLTTDSGVTGIGEVYTATYSPHLVAKMVEEVAQRHVIGHDPFHIEMMWRNVYGRGYSLRPDLTTGGIVSGLEMAMWDICGKETGKPVYELLGGRVHDKLRAYTYLYPPVGVDVYSDDPVYNDPAAAAEAAVREVERGFTGVKFDPAGRYSVFDGRQPALHAMDLSVKMVRAVREAVGTRADILFGTHGQFSASGAIRLAKQLEKYDPLWFEEPVPPDSPEEIAKVARATSIPISAGERLTTKYEFHQLLKHGAASILQPNLGRCGGLLEAKKIASMAEVYHAQIAPHLYCGPVVAAANIQLATCTPNFLILETIQGWQGFHSQVVKTAIKFENGFIIPPTEPGLGIELNEEVALAHPYTGSELHLEMSALPATLL
ncbi:MAG: mandelate racemase/muconate lactonizing enzyme family protein [Actinobacteria bacterium]|nr:mandelate racemase/muconate lactonizing enzyme family protein [Actinomycetota bacterium]